jgi:4-hydroxybenzoate polyprenyltransferase
MEAPTEKTAPAADKGLFGRVRLTLEMIKFAHTIFALPFALLAMVMAAGGWPAWTTALWIVLACVFARSAAMAFNRLHDERFDRLNPRTRNWPLPAGLLTRRFVTGFCAANAALFILSAGMLNRLALILSPVALLILLGYSTTKRWTMVSHFFLGLALGVAPIGAWIGASGGLDWPPVLLGLAVLCWVAGFDIIYSCQDADFDRGMGLHSLPSRLGKGRALAISAFCHALSIVLFAVAGWIGHLGWGYYSAVAIAAALLVYEQSIISPDDLSRLGLAFFTLNGWVSVLIFVGGLADILRRQT